jgi:hypothetical protein
MADSTMRMSLQSQGYRSAGSTVNTPPCGGFTALKCFWSNVSTRAVP